MGALEVIRHARGQHTGRLAGLRCLGGVGEQLEQSHTFVCEVRYILYMCIRVCVDAWICRYDISL